MTEEKQNQVEAITFKKTELDAFFPDQTPVEIIKKQNLKILSSWQRREQAREEAKASAPKPVPAPKAAEAQKKKIRGRGTIDAGNPGGNLYETVINECQCDVSTTVIVRDYGLSAISLNQILMTPGVQYKAGNGWAL